MRTRGGIASSLKKEEYEVGVVMLDRFNVDLWMMKDDHS
jgi:hypothetical protein